MRVYIRRCCPESRYASRTFFRNVLRSTACRGRGPVERIGRFEIYVQPYAGPGGKVRISANGGAQPRWNKNGKEIFYLSLDSRMMTAPVKLSPDRQSLETSTPAALFPVRIAGGPLPSPYKQQNAMSSDGQPFWSTSPRTKVRPLRLRCSTTGNPSTDLDILHRQRLTRLLHF